MDTETTYLGMKLRSPLVPSASPLSRDLSTLKQLEDAGAGAVVMYSLFEEEIALESQLLDQQLTLGTESFAEALTYFPEAGAYRTGPEPYLEDVRQAKEALDIPVIGSLNGVTNGGWIKYAKSIEEAGADGLELNLYNLPTDPAVTGAQVEQGYLELVEALREQLNIPLAVKLSPFFSSIPHAVQQLSGAGAGAVVLFNRFYQPDLDIDSLDVVPSLVLSDRDELRLPLRWIAILYGKVDIDLALTSGVHTAEDALKALMAGSSVVMMASELLARGVMRLKDIERDMLLWMDENEYESVTQLKGSLHPSPGFFLTCIGLKAVHFHGLLKIRERIPLAIPGGHFILLVAVKPDSIASLVSSSSLRDRFALGRFGQFRAKQSRPR
jgi:dihydroorotate dehydrogenase (fumarate)